MINPFEKEAYNICYRESDRYKLHYEEINYYPVWKYACDKLLGKNKVLELGCGPGHLAHMLYDAGAKNFTGIDFSEVGIKMAKEKVPSYTFIESDLNDVDYSKYSDFVFVSIETFEHLENDIRLIKKLPKNYMIFSVPDYWCVDHHRVYESEKFIRDYYKDVLSIISVKPFLVVENKTIFVVECNIT